MQLHVIVVLVRVSVQPEQKKEKRHAKYKEYAVTAAALISTVEALISYLPL